MLWKRSTMHLISISIDDGSELELKCNDFNQKTGDGCKAIIFIDGSGIKRPDRFIFEQKTLFHMLYSGRARICGQHTCSVWDNNVYKLLIYMQAIVRYARENAFLKCIDYTIGFVNPSSNETEMLVLTHLFHKRVENLNSWRCSCGVSVVDDGIPGLRRQLIQSNRLKFKIEDLAISCDKTQLFKQKKGSLSGIFDLVPYSKVVWQSMNWILPDLYNSSFVDENEEFEVILYDEDVSLGSEVMDEFKNLVGSLDLSVITGMDVSDGVDYQHVDTMNRLFGSLLDISKSQSYFIVTLGSQIVFDFVNVAGSILSTNRAMIQQWQCVNDQLNAALLEFEGSFYGCITNGVLKEMIKVCACAMKIYFICFIC